MGKKAEASFYRDTTKKIKSDCGVIFFQVKKANQS